MAASSFQESSRCDLQLNECGPLRFAGTDNYDRHLAFDHAVTLEATSQRERFGGSLERRAIYCRDVGNHRADLPNQQCPALYYLSREFVLGRMLVSNLVKLGGQHLWKTTETCVSGVK